jgi:tripartite-type tricarboxylate transporter receptor subunit TctC
MIRTFAAALAVAALVAVVAPAPATAQSADSYPAKPIRVIVPFAPGGALDTVARMVSQKMAERLGQPMIIENKPGAANVIGNEAVARAAPDGYTLLFAAAPIALNTALGMKLPYDVQKDFAPISLVASIPGIILANPASKYRTLEDIVAAARTTPGGLNVATAGAGSMPHLMLEGLAVKAGVKLNHIGYKGSVPAMQDTMSGAIDLLFDAWIPSGTQVVAGKLRPIAVNSTVRSPLIPEVPTVVELGYPEIVGSGFYGMLAPAGTPQAIVDKLHAAVVASVRQTDVADRLLKQGYEVHTSTPQEYSAFIRREIERWSPVARAAGLIKE